MKRLALVVVLLATAGCAATPRPREIDASANGANVALRVNQELVVNLDANRTTGFTWLLQTREGSILVPLGEPTYTARQGDPRLVGTSGITTFRFRATTPGREPLVFTYRRPWETNLPPAKFVRYEVTIEAAEGGTVLEQYIKR